MNLSEPRRWKSYSAVRIIILYQNFKQVFFSSTYKQSSFKKFSVLLYIKPFIKHKERIEGGVLCLYFLCPLPKCSCQVISVKNNSGDFLNFFSAYWLY